MGAWNSFNIEHPGQWRPKWDVQASAALALVFHLQSDCTKAFGGWGIDNSFVVGYAAPNCGDGIVACFEECDNGSLIEDDACASD